MRDARDDNLLRAIKACGTLAGYDLKKAAWADDLKNRVITITLQGSSAGWVQEALDFEMEGPTIDANVENPPPLEVTTDANMHVETVLDPSDLTETDETQPLTEEMEQARERVAAHGRRSR